MIVLAQETPDLVLPPDFGKEPRASMVESKQNIQQKNNAPQISQPMIVIKQSIQG